MRIVKSIPKTTKKGIGGSKSKYAKQYESIAGMCKSVPGQIVEFDPRDIDPNAQDDDAGLKLIRNLAAMVREGGSAFAGHPGKFTVTERKKLHRVYICYTPNEEDE